MTDFRSTLSPRKEESSARSPDWSPISRRGNVSGVGGEPRRESWNHGGRETQRKTRSDSSLPPDQRFSDLAVHVQRWIPGSHPRPTESVSWRWHSLGPLVPTSLEPVERFQRSEGDGAPVSADDGRQFGWLNVLTVPPEGT